MQLSKSTQSCATAAVCVSLCVRILSLIIINNKAVANEKSIFGCIGCGHCMAICPTGAIEISGREITPEDLFKLPDKNSASSYDQLLSLLQHRRSIREFSEKEIPTEIIEKILTAASTAPMGLPPSDVNVLIIIGREKTRAFVKDFSDYLKCLRYMSSKLFLALMRPFWGKANDEFFREFIKPLFSVYIDNMEILVMR